MSPNVSLTIIAICQLIMTAAGLVAVMALVYAIFAFKNLIDTKVDEALDRIQPVMDRAESVAQQAKETAESVGHKLDHIMARAESTADNVTDRVQSVSTKVEEAVNPQLATVAGIVTTAVRAFQLYQDITKTRHAKQAGYPPSVSSME